MTLATALYGGGGATKYRPGNLYPQNPSGIDTTASAANYDYLIPWSPRANMTLDRVAWYRDNSSSANVRVGLYSSAGVLLTDCANDNNTATGWHLVDTTNVALTANTFYWLCWNSSADVAGTQVQATGTAIADIRPRFEELVFEYGLAVGMGAAPGVTMDGPYLTKVRTNAALLATLVMSGWSTGGISSPSVVPAMGVVPA